jgi:hypothetical protein
MVAGDFINSAGAIIVDFSQADSIVGIQYVVSLNFNHYHGVSAAIIIKKKTYKALADFAVGKVLQNSKLLQPRKDDISSYL